MGQAEIREKIKCTHCGDPCHDTSVRIEDDIFCCTGCKTVFEILQEHELGMYYDLEANPGIRKESQADSGRFDYLDHENIQQIILEFQSQERNRLTFTIPAIHCSSCIWLLERLNRIHPGVLRVQVNFTQKETSIDYDPAQISLRELVELLTNIGYEPDLSLKSADRKEKNNSLATIIKLGIAGFAFGNVMLLSFPEYFGLVDVDRVTAYFPWIILAISLPAASYCGQDYFVSAWKGLRKKYISIDVPISLGILALMIQSIIEVINGDGNGYFDSLTGLLFFLLIGRWFQERTYARLSFDRDYKSYFPLAVMRMGDQEPQAVLVNDLEVGDVIRIRNQELIPADCTLLSNEARLDYSFVTGESDPEAKKEGDHIYAGGRHLGANILLRVEKEVSQSYLTRLWNDQAEEDGSSSTQRLIDQVGQYFTIVVMTIAVISTLAWLWIDPTKALFVFSATLIVACPCALALSVPFTWGSTMTVFGKNGLYLRNSMVLEPMARVDTLVFDKTGTITKANHSEISYSGRELSEMEEGLLKASVAHSTHPLSRLLFQQMNGAQLVELDEFDEVVGGGIISSSGGRVLKLGSASFVGEQETGQTLNTRVYISIDEKPAGEFSIGNEYRPGIKQVTSELAESYSLGILSGDHDGEKERLQKVFPKDSEMKFKQSPVDKLEYIRGLKDEGKSVLMLGDGLNDAGALKEADVGIAVTEDISQFTPASDAIMDAVKMPFLSRFMRFSKTSMTIVKISFAISFLYNLVGLGFAVTGNLTPVFAAILMPLSSISVVLFTTLSVNFMAKRIEL